MIMNNLEASYKYDLQHPTYEGEKARENMHYAATLAGMAFANASWASTTHCPQAGRGLRLRTASAFNCHAAGQVQRCQWQCQADALPKI